MERRRLYLDRVPDPSPCKCDLCKSSKWVCDGCGEVFPGVIALDYDTFERPVLCTNCAEQSGPDVWPVRLQHRNKAPGLDWWLA